MAYRRRFKKKRFKGRFGFKKRSKKKKLRRRIGYRM